MAPRHSLTDTYRTMAHLRRFFESVRRTITTEPTNGGLTPAQQFALLTLAGNPSNDPLTIGDLARETFATMNTTSALVRRMERAGLVRTTRSPKDHRFVYVKLTASGERRLRPSTAAVAKALRSAADEQGRAQLRTAFETWFDNWGAVVKALSSGKQMPRRARAARRH
ncbi:MAG TPA: MarR family transcriptional regulator, partial [Solirubrobacterales bacterium]|nr:MarR family transcriptional regulator [Solirubrobacterales bacterium]